MTVYNNWLNEIAKAANGESAATLSHLAATTTTLTIDVTDTALTGETPTRTALTGSRVNNTVTYTGTKTGASIATSDGETLLGAGFLSASTGGTLLSAFTLPSLIHTTNYDIEFELSFTVQRRGGT